MNSRERVLGAYKFGVTDFELHYSKSDGHKRYKNKKHDYLINSILKALKSKCRGYYIL